MDHLRQWWPESGQGKVRCSSRTRLNGVELISTLDEALV